MSVLTTSEPSLTIVVTTGTPSTSLAGTVIVEAHPDEVPLGSPESVITVNSTPLVGDTSPDEAEVHGGGGRPALPSLDKAVT